MRNKDIPEMVRRCLQEYQSDEPLQIMRRAGVKVMKNSALSSEWRLDKSTHGLSIHRYDTGEWFVIYDDSLGLEDRRFVIAHELGHIFLKHHVRQCGRRAECQADMFAEILLNKKSPIQTPPTKAKFV